MTEPQRKKLEKRVNRVVSALQELRRYDEGLDVAPDQRIKIGLCLDCERAQLDDALEQPGNKLFSLSG